MHETRRGKQILPVSATAIFCCCYCCAFVSCLLNRDRFKRRGRRRRGEWNRLLLQPANELIRKSWWWTFHDGSGLYSFTSLSHLSTFFWIQILFFSSSSFFSFLIPTLGGLFFVFCLTLSLKYKKKFYDKMFKNLLCCCCCVLWRCCVASFNSESNLNNYLRVPTEITVDWLTEILNQIDTRLTWHQQKQIVFNAPLPLFLLNHN